MHGLRSAFLPLRSSAEPGRAYRRRVRHRSRRSTAPGRRGSAVHPSASELWLPRWDPEAGDWPNMPAGGCCPPAAVALPLALPRRSALSSKLPQFLENAGNVRACERPNILASDHAVAVDHEGLGDSGRAKADLHVALRV